MGNSVQKFFRFFLISFLSAGICFWSQWMQIFHASPTSMRGVRQREPALQTCGPRGPVPLPAAFTAVCSWVLCGSQGPTWQ